MNYAKTGKELSMGIKGVVLNGAQVEHHSLYTITEQNIGHALSLEAFIISILLSC